MEDSTTSREYRRERDTFDLLLDLLLLVILAFVLTARFFTLLVGVENARLGVNVSARVIAALHNIRFTIQNLLCYGTIRKGTKNFFSSGYSAGNAPHTPLMSIPFKVK
jgi:hypothetical protein